MNIDSNNKVYATSKLTAPAAKEEGEVAVKINGKIVRLIIFEEDILSLKTERDFINTAKKVKEEVLNELALGNSDQFEIGDKEKIHVFIRIEEKAKKTYAETAELRAEKSINEQKINKMEEKLASLKTEETMTLDQIESKLEENQLLISYMIKEISVVDRDIVSLGKLILNVKKEIKEASKEKNLLQGFLGMQEKILQFESFLAEKTHRLLHLQTKLEKLYEIDKNLQNERKMHKKINFLEKDLKRLKKKHEEIEAKIEENAIKNIIYNRLQKAL